MHLILIRYKNEDSIRDIAVARNKPNAQKYVENLKTQYPSYRNGEFEFTRVKYIK